MFYSMIGKCKITQWWQCSICWQQTVHVETCTLFNQNCQPDKITLQVSVLIIEYLVAVSYEL